MHIRIPHHNTYASISDVRTIDLIRAILVLSKCSAFEGIGPVRTKYFLAERLVPNGRVHFKAQIFEGYYVIDVHYDSEKHLKKPTRITHGNSFCLVDNAEVRRFLNTFVLPIILKNRTHYHYRINENDQWIRQNTLLRGEM